MLRTRGSGIRCRASVECRRAFPRQLFPVLGPCPGGTIICLRRGQGCVSHQVTYSTRAAAAPPSSHTTCPCRRTPRRSSRRTPAKVEHHVELDIRERSVTKNDVVALWNGRAFPRSSVTVWWLGPCPCGHYYPPTRRLRVCQSSMYLLHRGCCFAAALLPLPCGA